MDSFYSADIVFTDVSDRSQQQPLFYQIGVRESLGRSECVLAVQNTVRTCVRCSWWAQHRLS